MNVEAGAGLGSQTNASGDRSLPAGGGKRPGVGEGRKSGAGKGKGGVGVRSREAVARGRNQEEQRWCQNRQGIGFHRQDKSRIGKSPQTEGRSVAFRSWEEGEKWGVSA